MLEIEESEIEEGKMQEYKMDDKSVLVAKVDGEVYAINNICTHRGCSLSEGTFEGKVVTCPCHGTEFDITNGKVVKYLGKMSKVAEKIASIGLIKDA